MYCFDFFLHYFGYFPKVLYDLDSPTIFEFSIISRFSNPYFFYRVRFTSGVTTSLCRSLVEVSPTLVPIFGPGLWGWVLEKDRGPIGLSFTRFFKETVFVTGAEQHTDEGLWVLL